MGRRARAPQGPVETVDALLSDERIAWLPVRHHSAACAHHVEAWIREHRPAAVLVEGPEDATELLRYVVDPATEPPVAVLTAFVDHKNTLGRNGVLTESKAVPARFRAWWPLVEHGPEWAALRAGQEVGADLRLIDAPLRAVLPYHTEERPSGDRHLAESAWFAALAARVRRPDFAAFWDATFEARAARLSTEAFFRELAVFAWCTRASSDDAAALEADGTLLREAHMRWHVDQVRKTTEGRIAVVTGGFHTVALPGTKGKRARAKADKGSSTLLVATSFPALVRWGALRVPRWEEELLTALRTGSSEPASTAAERLLVEVAAGLRAGGWPIGTADAVGAVQVARGLASLRGGGVAWQDVRDAVTGAFVKGDAGSHGRGVHAVLDEVVVGRRRGRLPPDAGRPPLLVDWETEAAAHRVDLSGAPREVRCDLANNVKHRAKSAFFHRCSLLGVPMFDALANGGDPPWFRGPDPIHGEGMHLLGETWGVRWSEEVDDTLLELSASGATLAEVTAAELGRLRLAAGQDLRARTHVLLHAARTRLVELIPALLVELRSALVVDPSFSHRVSALRELLLLYGSRDAWPTQGDRGLAELCAATFSAACLSLPTIASVPDDRASDAVDDLMALMRTALAPSLPDDLRPDRELLAERLRALTDDEEAQPLVRGAAAGARTALGDLGEGGVARLLRGHLLGPPSALRRAGLFLEGVLRTSRSTLLHGRRLLDAVHEVVGKLDEETFVAVLPDLRRAFSVFVPAELERVGERVAELLDPEPVEHLEPDAVAAERARTLDAEVHRALVRW
ncbi:MAG: hypothetical protein KC621_16285 [Myxococcales bacterium]|nr:hypothetical protein [Myxococcales bacterium]